MPQVERTGKRRKAIIEAALACFAEQGFSETTLEHIRVRSRASTGSIYHHFRSKEQLAAAVYVEGVVDYQTGLLAELARHQDARAGIAAMVRYYLRWVADHPEWARYLSRMRQAEFLEPTSERLKELNRALVREVSRWFEPHIRAGRLRNLPRDLYVALLLGPSQEFARQYLTSRARTDIETASAVLADATWRALEARHEPVLAPSTRKPKAPHNGRKERRDGR
jgi:AcrR family transcriptional regulator